MTEPKTSEEKITWLWDRLEAERAETARLRAQVRILNGQVDGLEGEVVGLRNMQRQMTDEIIAMSKELNGARQAAATAVHDHIVASTR